MTLPGYNHKMGQQIMTDIEGVEIDRAFLAHFHIDAEDAPAASSDGVHAAMNLGSTVQSITTGITNPAVPRNLQIAGNVSGITGNVKIYGTNFAGVAINETIALNGISGVAGNLAFKTVTKIELPVQVHTPAAQTETKQVTHKADAAGSVTLTLTAAGYAGDPVVVAVAQNDSAIVVAGKMVDALNDQEEFAAMFVASNNGTDTVTLTAIAPAVNDATLSLAFADTDTTGVTMGASTNGTTGVPYDKVSVGWGDKFGLPYVLYADELVILKLFGKAADTGTVTNDADELEKNVFDPNGTPDGQNDIDLYIIV